MAKQQKSGQYVVANPRQIPAGVPILTERSGEIAVPFYEGDSITPDDISDFDGFVKRGFIVEVNDG